jgi:hypothetical protein
VGGVGRGCVERRVTFGSVGRVGGVEQCGGHEVGQLLARANKERMLLCQTSEEWRSLQYVSIVCKCFVGLCL